MVSTRGCLTLLNFSLPWKGPVVGKFDWGWAGGRGQLLAGRTLVYVLVRVFSVNQANIVGIRGVEEGAGDD